MLRKISSRFHSNFVQSKYSSLHILSRNHYKIACPLAITFLILYTRSSDNQEYSAIYIFHWDIEIFEITGFSHVRNSNHLIIWWLIAVAAGSVKCGSKCNHYHILTTHSHMRENTLNIYWKKRRVRKLLIIFYCILPCSRVFNDGIVYVNAYQFCRDNVYIYWCTSQSSAMIAIWLVIVYGNV